MNTHDGHRERLYKKYTEGVIPLSDVEFIELMLTFCIARKDVRPIAQRLLDRYGSPESILRAPSESIMNIEGVSYKSAAFFKLVYDWSRIFNADKEVISSPLNVSSAVSFFMEHFKHANAEQLIVAVLDENGDLINKVFYSDAEKDSVRIELKTIMRDIGTDKSAKRAVVIAHNHFSGNVTPSIHDDMTTKKLLVLFSLNGIKLYDHLIFCGDKYFSYFTSGRLEQLLDEISL